MCDEKDVAYITVTTPYIITTSVSCTENFSILNSSAYFGLVWSTTSLLLDQSYSLHSQTHKRQTKLYEPTKYKQASSCVNIKKCSVSPEKVQGKYFP